jgi:phosphate-selective porin
MTRFMVAVALSALLAACSSSSSQSNTAAENPVDVCADKGVGPTHPDYEKCLEETARGRCSQAGTAESAEYGDCMKNQSDAAFARDAVRRWGY